MSVINLLIHIIENWFDKVIKRLKINPNILFTQKLFSLTKMCAKIVFKIKFTTKLNNLQKQIPCTYYINHGLIRIDLYVLILQESASCRHVPFLHVHTYLTEYIALYTSLIKVNITKSCRGIFCIWNSIQEFMKFTLINEGKWICKHVLFHKLSIFWNYNALPALMCNMLSIVLMTLSLLLYYKSQFFGNLGCLTMSIHLMMRNAHSM